MVTTGLNSFTPWEMPPVLMALEAWWAPETGWSLVTRGKSPAPFASWLTGCVLVTIPTIPMPQLNLCCLNFGHYRRHVGMNNAHRGLQLVSQSGRYLYHAQTSNNIKITSEFPTACFESQWGYYRWRSQAHLKTECGILDYLTRTWAITRIVRHLINKESLHSGYINHGHFNQYTFNYH